MIGLDANVLIRFLVGDDPEQSQRARDIITSLSAEQPGYVSLVALVETLWVLRHHYRVARERILDVVGGLLDVPTLRFQCSDDVRLAIDASRRQGIDLPDALLAQLDVAAGCSTTLTFDRRVTRLPSMSLVGQ